MTTHSDRIRELNDALRTKGIGGEIVVTPGLLAHGTKVLAAVFAAVQGFDPFTPDNDPYGEHDCAVVEVAELRILFKIDYYNVSLSGHSPDPADTYASGYDPHAGR